MRTETIELYQFNELNSAAKENARDWYRQGGFDYDWYDSVYEDAKNVGLKITGFDCGRGSSIDIEYISGWSIGDVCRQIIKDHGEHCDTYKFAMEFYRLRHTGYTRKQGEDYREEFLQGIGEEYLSMLRKELEYLESNESIDENIIANEYEFTSTGKRA